MRKRSRSLAWVAGAALAIAFSFSPATPKASAWDGGGRFAFSGRFVGPHGRVFIRGGHFPRFAHRRFFVDPPVFVHRAYFPPLPTLRRFLYYPFPPLALP